MAGPTTGIYGGQYGGVQTSTLEQQLNQAGLTKLGNNIFNAQGQVVGTIDAQGNPVFHDTSKDFQGATPPVGAIYDPSTGNYYRAGDNSKTPLTAAELQAMHVSSAAAGQVGRTPTLSLHVDPTTGQGYTFNDMTGQVNQIGVIGTPGMSDQEKANLEQGFREQQLNQTERQNQIAALDAAQKNMIAKFTALDNSNLNHAQLQEQARKTNIDAAVAQYQAQAQAVSKLADITAQESARVQQILENGTDFVARAFESRGEKSPLARVTQADQINTLYAANNALRQSLGNIPDFQAAGGGNTKIPDMPDISGLSVPPQANPISLQRAQVPGSSSPAADAAAPSGTGGSPSGGGGGFSSQAAAPAPNPNMDWASAMSLFGLAANPFGMGSGAPEATVQAAPSEATAAPSNAFQAGGYAPQNTPKIGQSIWGGLSGLYNGANGTINNLVGPQAPLALNGPAVSSPYDLSAWYGSGGPYIPTGNSGTNYGSNQLPAPSPYYWNGSSSSGGEFAEGTPGFTHLSKFVVGDSTNSKPNPEIIENPQNAPIRVVPQSEYHGGKAKGGRGFAGGTDYGWGSGEGEAQAGGSSPSNQLMASGQGYFGTPSQMIGGMIAPESNPGVWGRLAGMLGGGQRDARMAELFAQYDNPINRARMLQEDNITRASGKYMPGFATGTDQTLAAGIAAGTPGWQQAAQNSAMGNLGPAGAGYTGTGDPSQAVFNTQQAQNQVNYPGMNFQSWGQARGNGPGSAAYAAQVNASKSSPMNGWVTSTPFVSQDELINQATQKLPPAVRDVLNGGMPKPLLSTGFNALTNRQYTALTPEERDAMGAYTSLKYNAPLSFIQQLVQQSYGSPGDLRQGATTAKGL